MSPKLGVMARIPSDLLWYAVDHIGLAIEKITGKKIKRNKERMLLCHNLPEKYGSDNPFWNRVEITIKCWRILAKNAARGG